MEKYFPELNEKYRKKIIPMVYLQECIRTQKKCPGCNVDHEQNKTYLAEWMLPLQAW